MGWLLQLQSTVLLMQMELLAKLFACHLVVLVVRVGELMGQQVQLHQQDCQTEAASA